MVVLFSQAQFYNGSRMTFGKNRVQHQNREWIYIKQPDFDVYFYTQGRPLAQYTAYKAQQYALEIEQKLNFTLNQKLLFFVYETFADFKESNFNYDNELFYNTGGVVPVFGPKIFLYFDGSYANYNTLMKEGIAQVYIQALLQGETYRANYSAAALINLPEWFTSGLTAYLAGAFDSYAAAYIKDGIQTKRYLRPELLKQQDARYFGLSFWQFVSGKYGEIVVASLLHATRSAKNYQRGIQLALGMSYQELMVEWYKYYMKHFNQFAKDDFSGNTVIKKAKSDVKFQQFKLNPVNESYAFVTNQSGQIKIWLKKPENRRPKRVFKKHYKLEDNPDYSFPVLTWTPDGEYLTYALERKGKTFLHFMNASTRKVEETYWLNVKKVRSFCFSQDQKTLLLAGVNNGQSDIYQYFFRTRAILPVTNDIYDDRDPIYMDDAAKKIVFSSNRPNEILSGNRAFNAEVNNSFNLFCYDLDLKKNQLTRLTSSKNTSEIGLQRINSEYFSCLTNQNGIFNRSIARFDSTILKIDTAIHYGYRAKSTPNSNYSTSVFEQDIAGERIAEIFYFNGQYQMVLSPLDLNFKTELSPKKDLSILSARNEFRTSASTSDTVYRRKRFVQLRAGDVSETTIEQNSQFNTADSDSENKLSNFPTLNYFVQFTLNKLITRADIGFLNASYQTFTGGKSPVFLNSGLSGLMMFGIHDLFEDYRYMGGVNFSLNFNNLEFLFSYENLKKRLDKQFVVHYQHLKSSQEGFVIKQKSLSAYYILKYPIDIANSIRVQFKGVYDRIILGSLSDYTLKTPDRHKVRVALQLSYIFDNIRYLDQNLYSGIRSKVFGEYYQSVQKNTQNMVVLGLDFRYYLPLFKNMIWANRLAAGTSFGQEKLIYYMGGVDGWLFPKFNNEIWVDTTMNYAYQTLATNMRGFTQNIRNGNSFLLLSSELRIPFVQMIFRHPVKNNFIRSLQLVAFGETGTAWTGLTPYSKNNSLYLRYIDAQPMHIMIRRKINPIVGGIGLGLRAQLFGYILRFDYAWGIEDGKILKKGVFYFSLGLDF